MVEVGQVADKVNRGIGVQGRSRPVRALKDD